MNMREEENEDLTCFNNSLEKKKTEFLSSLISSTDIIPDIKAIEDSRENYSQIIF